MTSFAKTDPVLRRLFERLDLAPQPKDQALSHLFAYWEKRRDDHIAPSLGEIDIADLGDASANAFILHFDPHDGKSTLMFGGAAFESLMGPCDPGMIVLAEAPGRRGAVRLRRLSEFVRQRAEPALAEFEMEAVGGAMVRVEMFLAPLSRNGRSVDGLFGGLALRHIHTARVSPTHASHTLHKHDEPLVFALSPSGDLGRRIASHLGRDLRSHEEREFEDGEHKIRPLVDVHGRVVQVIAGLHAGAGQSVNDRLCRLLFFIAALKDAGAVRVTIVAPYLCYARKDRRTKPNDPVTSRYVAQLFEAMGMDRIVTMEVHNLAAFENAFRCSTTHLEAHALLAHHIATSVGHGKVAVVSPDIGGAKRAELFRQTLEEILGRAVSKALADKQRSMGQVSGDLFVGDVSDCTTVIVDDLISTGTTMARVAQQCRERGASRVIVAATHGVGGAAALPNLTHPWIDEIVLTDTIPQSTAFVEALGSRLTILDTSEVFAQALV